MSGRYAADRVEGAIRQVLNAGGTTEEALAAGRAEGERHSTGDLLGARTELARDIARGER
ncbi:hypothetical protein SRB5_51720 [Streptomyces sp. RB5]|uniref:Uncharacterized protein n=1 Tax=Streptomyces smaragdinus TaxID=2585196 RepID=A0A7K0CND0_9ACTN|nr:hypothetical protein [Streptomyces smaragdinus]MQY14995.1 hypothetical protein [Streptomyces smaragdinus]